MVTSPLFTLLLLLATTTAQPYKATDRFLVDCGSSTSTNTSDGKWVGDDPSEFIPSNISATSFASTSPYIDPSVPTIPYSTARIINASSFTYMFRVTQGPKFLRLHFYPATYSNLNPNKSFFSVSSNGYSLLTNFNAFLAASLIGKTRSDAGHLGPSVPHFVKEFMIYVNDAEILQVIFTPSFNSYAFINGIEIVSMPENLYFNGTEFKYVNQYTGPIIDNSFALETMYRLNMGGSSISGNEDTGMFRAWSQDHDYVFGKLGLTPVNMTPITYTNETPNYTAHVVDFQFHRVDSKSYN